MLFKRIAGFLGVLIYSLTFHAASLDDWLQTFEDDYILDDNFLFTSDTPTNAPEDDEVNVYVSLKVYLLQKEPDKANNDCADKTENTADMLDETPHDEPVEIQKTSEEIKPEAVESKTDLASSSGVGKKRRTHWTKKEDKQLKEIIATLGDNQSIPWDRVARKFYRATNKRRTNKQVRERFTNHLDNVHKGPLDDATKKQIVDLQQAMGRKWSAIAKIINEDRAGQRITALTIKNFYYSFINQAQL